MPNEDTPLHPRLRPTLPPAKAGKGNKGKGKGKGKFKGKKGHARTPANKPICFRYNSKGGCKKKAKCHFEHVCTLLWQPSCYRLPAEGYERYPGQDKLTRPENRAATSISCYRQGACRAISLLRQAATRRYDRVSTPPSLGLQATDNLCGYTAKAEN